MKIFIPILFLICFWSAGYSQRVQSSCTAPDSIVNLYADDAAKLAFDVMYQKNHSYWDSTDIPHSLQDTFLHALVAVYNSDLRAVDTIIDKARFLDPESYNIFYGTIFIHNQQYTSCRRFNVEYLDTTLEWENNLVHGIFPTGNAGIDSLVSAFGIRYDSTTYYEQFCFSTQKFYNTAFIVRRWNEITNRKPRAAFADNWDFGSPPFTIEQRINDTSITLAYTYGWGDCPSGCTGHHSWYFSVFGDCSVRYDSSKGATFRVSSVENQYFEKPEFTLFPNPSSDNITIESQHQSQIEVIDVTGKIIQRMQTNSDQEEIDISQLPKGIYLVRAFDKKGNINTAKFMKE
jgi:hypothetical protein